MYPPRHTGAALLVILIVTTIMTTLSSLIVEVSLLTMRMESTAKFSALKVAETTLGSIQQQLDNRLTPLENCPGNDDSICLSAVDLNNEAINDLNWWHQHATPVAKQDKTQSYSFITELQKVNVSPKQDKPIYKYYYQVRVMTYLSDEDMMTIIQATFAKIFAPGYDPACQKLSWLQLV